MTSPVHTYNLTLDGLEVTAVLTYNGSYGLLLCSFDDRAITVRLGSQAAYLREDACRALKSRRVLTEMVGESPYSRKATCRAIANRLDLLERQMDIAEGEAQAVITEVRGKWRGLQTSHDFDRFVSTNATAKAHLTLCKRTDDDFETLIAPALAVAIKEDIETDLEIGAPVMGAADKDAGLAVAQLATDKLNEVLAFHGLTECETYADGIDALDETVADLRDCLAESDDLASDRWTALGAVNEALRCVLDDRGVPASEHVGENLRAVVEYLSAVEAAVAKWQAAGLAWQRTSRGTTPMEVHEVLRTYPPDTLRRFPWVIDRNGPPPEVRHPSVLERLDALTNDDMPASAVKVEKRPSVEDSMEYAGPGGMLSPESVALLEQRMAENDQPCWYKVRVLDKETT